MSYAKVDCGHLNLDAKISQIPTSANLCLYHNFVDMFSNFYTDEIP